MSSVVAASLPLSSTCISSEDNKVIKPTLVIGCSAKKAPVASQAFDLYQGGLYQMLRSALGDPTQYFNIAILSAQHGLIPASKVIEPYDLKMASRKDTGSIHAFAEQHKKAAIKLLSGLSKNGGDLFVALSNDYLASFDAMLDGTSTLKKFNSHYISRGHQGIGELRGRLNRVIQLVLNPLPNGNETYFRSGVANRSELGYVAAGCAVGSSLAHCNTRRNTTLLSSLLESTKHNFLFLDNGLVTAHRQGKALDYGQVFAEYEKIVNSVPLAQSRNISIVVPDDVACNENALHIAMRYSKEICRLAKRCEVILPVHRSDDMKNHALAMLKAVKFNKNIRVGIPCLTKKDCNLALSLSQIDALLSVKKPNGDKAVKKIHFFGMSDSTKNEKLNCRLTLARLHGLHGDAISLDACRTAAIFGYTSSGLRKGSQEEVRLKTEHERKQVISSTMFQSHSYKAEQRCENSWGFVTQDLYDLINEDDIHLFWLAYNEAMKAHPSLLINADFSESEVDDSMELAWQITSQRTVDELLFESLKDAKWNKFSYLLNVTALATSEARFEAIRNLFKTERPVQMQMQLDLVA